MKPKRGKASAALAKKEGDDDPLPRPAAKKLPSFVRSESMPIISPTHSHN
jgi:hypothetical protein